MRLIALVESPEHVCCRYRLESFRAHLEASGHTLELRTLPRGLFSRVSLFRELRTSDVVVLQRKLLPRTQLAMLRRYARRIVFDFDDAVWHRDSYDVKGLHSYRRIRRFARTVQSSEVVVAGNSFLSAEAARYSKDTRVMVIPTCVDPSEYPIATHMLRRSPGLNLVWVGSSSTLQGLERIRPILESIGRNIPGSRLKLVCDRFVGFANLPVDPIPWCAATESREIATADVGIAWMPDDPWSRGKCGLKVLQYHAAGLPVIANPVGVHNEFVTHGENGFTANTPDEWLTAAHALTDANLRRTLGHAGRAQLEERYSVAAGAKHWVELLHEFADPVAGRRTG